MDIKTKIVLVVLFGCVFVVSRCDKQKMEVMIQNKNSKLSATKFPETKEFINTLGMRFVRIEPGDFIMGQKEGGDWDERPIHKVSISKSFYMGVIEITNAQYEMYDSDHRMLRGKMGFSKDDDEAVVFVSWHDAISFCKWLSDKEGLPYRLPTEAEWEYACRAGTNTPFYTGDSLPTVFHKNVRQSWYPDPRTTSAYPDTNWATWQEHELPSSFVGRTPPNSWGLYDMHGNVEEWCSDWFGPYDAADQVDPVGFVYGDFKVTRGGSHSTKLTFLRSANRLGTLPEDKHWLIGFRVVLGKMPCTVPLPKLPHQSYQTNVKQEIPPELAKGPDPDKPYFKGPRTYVKIPPNSDGPLFSKHNHDPAIVECPNGDLIAIWYSCQVESGRELAVAVSRLRYGEEEWEPASPFWDAPDRNDHCPGMWFDGNKTIYHFNGLSAAATWGNLAIIMRTSTDNGTTWSRARLIVPDHGYRQMVGEPAFRTQDGAIIFGADAVFGSTVWISRDNGLNWNDPGGTINGIHAGIVELNDGRLMALGRGMNVNNRMPKSISSDMGKTWQVTASPFPPLTGGQRMAMIRLKEGPIFLATFTDSMVIKDTAGVMRTVSGLFGALSFDEGETWPIRRLITDDGPGRKLNGGAWTRDFVMDHNHAEPKGYMSVCQTADGVIQLISSALHYAFNLTWLKESMPAIKIK